MTKTNLFLVSLVPGIPALFLLYLLIDALFLSGSSPGGMLFVVAILAAVGCIGLLVLAGASFYIGESAAPRAPKKPKADKADQFAEGGDDGGDVSFEDEANSETMLDENSGADEWDGVEFGDEEQEAEQK